MNHDNGPGDFQKNGYGPDFEPGFGTEGTEGLQLPPWERRERFGFLNGLYLTIKDVLFTPRQFFHRMPSEVGMLPPLLFAVAMGMIAFFFTWMWSLAGSPIKLLFTDNIEEAFWGPFVQFFLFICSPILIPFLIFLGAGLLHGCLMIFGGNKLGFEATLRVASYGMATCILALIPFCGSPIGLLWVTFVLMVGLYSIHDIEPWKSVVSVLFSMMVLFSLFGAGTIFSYPFWN